MPKATTQPRQKNLNEHTPTGDEIPLPTLHHPETANPKQRVTTIRVLPKPRFGGTRGMTWSIKDEPPEHLMKGMLIALSTSTQVSGTGKLVQTTDLCQHWVTFAISGGHQPCIIRVPIPWATLDSLEGYTHTTRYSALPPLPKPHPALRPREEPRDGSNPYVSAGWEVNRNQMERRMARIANVP